MKLFVLAGLIAFGVIACGDLSQEGFESGASTYNLSSEVGSLSASSLSTKVCGTSLDATKQVQFCQSQGNSCGYCVTTCAGELKRDPFKRCKK